MKVFEIRRPSARRLHEQFDPQNHTGFVTEDLVAIAQAHQADKWAGPQTYEEFIAEDETAYQAWLSSQGGKV